MQIRGAQGDPLRNQLTETQNRVRELEAELRARDTHDSRTQLLAHDTFLESAEQALQTCEHAGNPLCVAVIDIDGFRELNARRGHAAGNAALVGIAALLRRLPGPNDVLGRTGADEFTVAMSGAGVEKTRTFCDRLIAELERDEIAEAGLVSVSAGVSLHQSGQALGAVLAMAQAAVDRARALGGGRTSVRIDDGTTVAVSHAQAAVVEALAGTLLTRDRYTGEHSEAVVKLSRNVASQLGLNPRDIETVGAAAQLRDIGKVAIPDSVLKKPGTLDEDEWNLMREHPVIGERILQSIPGLAAVARIVRHEHEHWNGSGYPDNLFGDGIPIGSRIILACDAYVAMTTERPYREVLAHGAALAELSRCAGTQFDPKVTEALIGCLYWERQTGLRSTG